MFHLSGDDWSAFKTQIWSIIQSHVQKRAILQEADQTWTVCDADPSVDMFDKYISLRYKTRILTPCDENEAHRFLVKYRGETLTLSVYKWGNEICTSEQQSEFIKQCIEPLETDRAGAGSEASLRVVMDRLKAKWGEILHGQSISWRLWANAILRQPRHKHDSEIAKPVPSNLVRYFRPLSASGQQHLQRLQRNASLARDVVRSLIADVESFQADHELMRIKLVATHTMLLGKQEVIEGFIQEMSPQPTDMEALMALSLVPNQDDVDHEL
ncbi:hypothetical protein AeRB84_004816 [Aphanomyces euteiches]|nr:hypothetical protein AeRB84_004816 [Aphanomyces euteiches]